MQFQENYYRLFLMRLNVGGQLFQNFVRLIVSVTKRVHKLNHNHLSHFGLTLLDAEEGGVRMPL